MNARCDTVLHARLDDFLDGRNQLGMVELTRNSQRRGKVRWTYQDGIHARYRQQLIALLKTRDRLDLVWQSVFDDHGLAEFGLRVRLHFAREEVRRHPRRQ